MAKNAEGGPATWPFALGMRAWLSVAFAAVVVLTVVTIVAILNGHADSAFRQYGEEFAVGSTYLSAQALRNDTSPREWRTDTTNLSKQRRLSLFLFSPTGRLLSVPVSRGVLWSNVPEGSAALRSALVHRRYVYGTRDGSSFVVSTALTHFPSSPVLVGYSRRPELRSQLGVVRHEFLDSGSDRLSDWRRRWPCDRNTHGTPLVPDR